MTPHDEPTTDGKLPSSHDETVDHRPPQDTDVASGAGTRSGAGEDTDLATSSSRPDPVRLDPAALGRGAADAGRYTLHGELARGGMGVILRGRDVDLGRELAVKVLLEGNRDRPEVLRRFIEEAQIGGQLQHPGVVPVYDLGTLDDHRPFFAMKLVKGRTLSALLRERADPTSELPRFLGIFEQIAQTIGYAHSKGVIHRDLKPSNVMVGAFGEVQVMDWGLAKTLGSADAPAADDAIRTVRTEDGADLSQAGSILGTPAYMAPEQARGEVDAVDERADVFGLGAILCEVLTARPPFVGANTVEVLQKAAQADTTEALARIDACGLDLELIALAKDCLASLPADRPRDAGVVADRITAHLAGVQERLRTAERERAVAEARAVEERRRRRLQVGLVASVLALFVVAGAVVTVGLQQRAARAALVAKVMGEATSLRDQAIAHADDLGRWQAAREAIRRVEVALGPGGDPALGRRLAELTREIDEGDRAARDDQDLMATLVDIRSAKADDVGGRASDAAYVAAFRGAGLDIDKLSAKEAGDKIRGRPPAVALALAAALDEWTSIRHEVRDEPGAKRLADAAQVADPDPWRGELRAILGRKDQSARLASLRKLVETAKPDQLGPIGLDRLGAALNGADDPKGAEAILRIAQRKFPGDVWVNHDLASILEESGRRDEAIRYYTAARSIRPETAHELAHALESKGETDEAIAVFEDLAQLRPKDGRHLGCLGSLLQSKGRLAEAGKALDAAIAAHRETIRLQPDNEFARGLLGLALMGQGKFAEAEATYREKVRLRPDSAVSHDSLARALEEQNKFDEAIASYREAIRLAPRNATSYQNLSAPLAQTGRLAEAEEVIRKAIELRPDDARSHVNLGHILKLQGRYDESAAAYRESARLRDNYANAHYSLGQVLFLKGDHEGADASLRRAIALAPAGSPEQMNYAGMLQANEVRLAMAARLPGILGGQAEPKSTGEAVEFGDIARGKGLYAASSQLFARAMKGDANLARDRAAQVRYKAAKVASLAGTGRGKDDPAPDEAAKTGLRDQARGWLTAELAFWRRITRTVGDPNRPLVSTALAAWQKDPDLAGIRDEPELAKLPEKERQEWRSFWAEVEALRKRSQPD